MTDSVTLHIEGLDGVMEKLQQLSNAAGPQSSYKLVKGATKAGAMVVKDNVVERAHRIDRPRTKRSIYKDVAIRAGTKSENDQVGGVISHVGINKKGPGGNVFYWWHVELGTRRARAKPFMRPAMEDNQNKIVDAFVENINEQLDIALKGS